MDRKKIMHVFNCVYNDVCIDGKSVRIIGDMSSKNDMPYYFKIRNMVSRDLGANICYAGFSKKDFKKLYKLLKKFDNKKYYIIINPSGLCDENENKEVEGNILIIPLKDN